MTILACDVPAGTLLHEYVQQHYSDCYSTTVQSNVDLARFIIAFYNSNGFRPERILLGLAFGRHADNQSTADLAADKTQKFSAWEVEKRLANEILLADISGATRSWLMVEALSSGITRLYFGSAVVRKSGDEGRRPLLFRALMPFHRIYSRVLLGSAVSEL